VPSATVTGGFFSMLGVAPWRGRLFDATDVKPGAPPVTVISYAAWQTKFAGSDDALGQVVKLDDVAHTIIGVLPPAFEFVDPVQFWRPLPLSAAGAPGQLRIQMIRVFGRVLPGADFAAAQRELDAISERFWTNLTSGLFLGPGPGGDGRRINAGPGPGSGAPDGGPRIVRGGPESVSAAGPGGGPGAPSPDGPQRIVRPAEAPPPGGSGQLALDRQTVGNGPPGPGGPRPRIALPFANTSTQLVPLQEQLARQSRTTLWLLLGAVAFVLLIACANLANLQLARAAGRRREIAIRAALGASPRRLAAGLLIENLLLAIAGGLLGVLLAWWGSQALQVWLADYLPRINPVGVSLPVLGFAVVLAVAAGLGFGLAPAWQGSRIDLLDTLKDGGHQSSPSGHRWRQGLIALEIALALVLTVNTGLLVKSIYRLYSAELGYRTADVLTANLSLPRRYATPAQQRDFADRWLAALTALPGVKSAALTDAPPLSPYSQIVLGVTQGSGAGVNASVGAAPPTMSIASITPDYFRTTGIALRQGRFFTDQDGADAPAVAVVNEEFVRIFYPQGLTLGAQVNIPSNGSSHGPPATAAIIGVVANTRPRGFDSAPQPLAYFPLTQQPRTRLSAVLQFAGDAAAISRAATLATAKADPDLAVDTPLTLEQQLARQTAPRRVTLMLTGAFAATAVLLASLGIFGVMSYTVTQRTQEIGVRMALGANSAMILRWILRYGGLAVGAGLLVGLALVFTTGKLLASLLHGVTASDPVILALGVVALAGVGLAACLLPALRATRVNPVDALRSE
jgi:predicted permease